LDFPNLSVAVQQPSDGPCLGPARESARPGDDRDFVEDDGRVFDKHGVWKIGRFIELHDRASGGLESPLVGGVLLASAFDVDRLATKMRQLACVDRSADGSCDGDHEITDSVI
jgi:hypothetical protein